MKLPDVDYATHRAFSSWLVLSKARPRKRFGARFLRGHDDHELFSFALFCVGEASGTFAESTPSSRSINFLAEDGNQINSSLWRSTDWLFFTVIPNEI